jgi:hypothetical protein
LHSAGNPAHPIDHQFPTGAFVSPRFVHVGHRGASPDFGKTLCGKLTGLNTPLSEQPDQVNCPTCRRRLQAGWLRWEDVPRESDSGMP